MIIYRPVAPLTTGSPGLASALAAMALTAVFGPAWQVRDEPSAAPVGSGAAAGNAFPDAAGRNQP